MQSLGMTYLEGMGMRCKAWESLYIRHRNMIQGMGNTYVRHGRHDNDLHGRHEDGNAQLGNRGTSCKGFKMNFEGMGMSCEGLEVCLRHGNEV